jgi:orotidine-5'-phosphate decarboxylase
MSHPPKIFVAADTPDLDRAKEIAAIVTATGQGLKIGLEFYNAHGPQGVRTLREAYPDAPVFLDVKFHDIPNTVAGAMRAVSALDIMYVNVHATGGEAMMRAATDAAQGGADKAGVQAPKVLSVTLLTSLDLDDMKDVGLSGGPVELVTRLARLSHEAGLHGVVCSSVEIEALRRDMPEDFILMVPGIRPAGSAQGDQKRVMTPAEAMQSGASHLVIGRPITQSDDPKKTIETILGTLA